MRQVQTVRVLMLCLLLMLVAACQRETPRGPGVPAERVASASADTPVPPARRETPTNGGTRQTATVVATSTVTPDPTATVRPSATPIPTPRPLAEGECIAWSEAPSFLGRDVCVEGRVNFVRSANPARTLFFLVIDPSVPDIDHCCGLLYGWLYANKVYEATPSGGMSKLFEGNCIRLRGTVEKGEGNQHLVPIKSPDQLEIIECSACQIPEACGL
jgi:hypothetical protein